MCSRARASWTRLPHTLNTTRSVFRKTFTHMATTSCDCDLRPTRFCAHVHIAHCELCETPLCSRTHLHTKTRRTDGDRKGEDNKRKSAVALHDTAGRQWTQVSTTVSTCGGLCKRWHDSLGRPVCWYVALPPLLSWRAAHAQSQ